MSLLFTLEELLKSGVYPRDKWWQSDDDDDDDDSGGGGGGDDDDDDDDSGGGGGGGDDDDDDSGGGDFDPGDSGGDFDFGDDDDDQGDDSGDSGFDWGDQGSDQGDQGDDSGWVAVQDYEENGRTIRKFTDNTGTDYFQDVGEWPSGSATDRSRNGDSGFDWGDTDQRDNWMRGEPDRQMPEVDQDIQDLHDYYHPYTVSKFEDDPVRRGWGDGVATDGTRFDQQDGPTQEMFGQAYGDRAAQFWAEQRSRDLEAEFRSRGVVTLPQQQQPQDMAPSAGAQSPLFGLQHPTNPDGTPVQYAVGPDPNAPQPANALGLGAIGEVPAPTSTPYIPPAVAEAPPTPPAEEAVPHPQPAAPPSPPVAPPAGQQAAADAAARATAAAGGSPQQVADAAAAAALAYDRRNLTSESPETQREFEQAFGDQANERWVQQHNRELMLNRALYGTEEPRAGSPQVGLPGLGNVGPAPDRTIGRAELSPWQRLMQELPPSPGAVGVPAQASSAAPSQSPPPSAIYTPPATQGVPSVLGDTGAPPSSAAVLTAVPPPPSAIDSALRRAANVPMPAYTEPPARANIPPMPAAPTPGEFGAPPTDDFERNRPVAAPPPVEGGPGVQIMGGTEGAPTQTMAEAGFERTSAVGPIDASLRTVANVPTPPPAESPDDLVTIRDDAMRTTRVVPSDQLDSWMRSPAPGVPNPWRVVDARPANPAPTPPPPPTGPAIDGNIRTAAGVPTPAYDDNMGPRESQVNPDLSMNSDPFGFVTSVAAQQQGDTNVEAFGRNVANGISAGESWAEPYTADLARLAWYRETRGLEGDPTKAPDSYVRDWMGAFRAGNTNVAGVQEMSQALVDRGVAPPSNDPFGVVASQAARDQGATDLAGFKRAVAGGIAAGEAWTKPYTDQLARMAWYKESGGREGGPENAPQSYINDWTSALRAADTNTPGVRMVNQQLINMGARIPASNPNQPFNWQAVYGPTGEGLGANGPSLISQQATKIDCGPNAFSNIMRSQGYNAAPIDAFTFAKEGGYHNGSEFTGPVQFANMLRNELGLQAKAEPVNWSVIDKELAEGRLVTLSSRGHYWTVVAKNDQGQYNVGATGTFVGNPAWSRPDQIQFGGRPDTMITYSGAIDPHSRAVMSPTLKVVPPPTQQATPTMVSAPPRQQMQSDEQAPQALVAPEAQPPEEDLWQATPRRWERMEQFQALPEPERARVFEDAMDQGLAAEGITGSDADYWKRNMRMVVTGDGLAPGSHGENTDLNPYMIAGESGGRRGTADRRNSSALGYFQFLRQNPNGSTYSHVQYVPDEYKNKPYDPTGQVRQFIRAIKASKKYNGDPGAVVRDKNTTNKWGP